MIIVNLFKKIFHKEKDIHVKDIIWIKRYKNELELEQLETGHREGPCIVFKIKRNKIYVLICGSHMPKNEIFKYKLDKDIYSLDKTTYAYLGKLELLNKSQYIKTIAKLNDQDFNTLNKALYYYYINIKKIEKLKLKKIKFNITIGDIINYNNTLYYIFELDDKKYYCYKVFISKTDNRYSIILNDIIYNFNYIKVFEIDKNAKIKFINYANSNKQKLILIHKDNKLKELSRIDILERGKIIRYKRLYYYIYNEYKNNLIVFRLYNNYNNKLECVTINDKKYYSNLKEIIIYRNDYIKVVGTASVEEMDNIRDLKKVLKEEKKEDFEKRKIKPQIDFKYYVPFTIINDIYTLEKYVIVKREKNRITILPYPELDKIILYEIPNSDIKYNIQGKVTGLDKENLLIKLKNIEY